MESATGLTISDTPTNRISLKQTDNTVADDFGNVVGRLTILYHLTGWLIIEELLSARFRPQKSLRNAHRNANTNARETLGTAKAAVYGGIAQSWKISWAPHLLLGSTASAPMAMPAAGSVFDFLKIG